MGALRPQCQMPEIRAGCRTRRLAQRHELAIGQHHLDGINDIFDVAVRGRKLARGTSRNPSADRADTDRLWPVANGQSSRCDGLLRDESIDTRFNSEEQVLLVDRQHPIHSAHVDENLIGLRLNTPTDAATQTPGHYGNVVLRGKAHHCLHLRRIAGAHNASGRIQRLSSPVLPVLQAPTVKAICREDIGINRHLLSAEQLS